MAIVVYGSSDDIISIDGDFEEEFYCYHAEEDETDPTYLAFSDGTLLTVHYDTTGIWRFGLVKEGTSDFTKEEGMDDSFHSDRITLDGDITWVILGTDVAK